MTGSADLSVVSVLQNAVLPAVVAVLQEAEIDSLSLGDEPPPGLSGVVSTPGVLWLVITAVDERFFISIAADAVQSMGWDGMRDHLTDELRSFVAESTFGWGENR